MCVFELSRPLGQTCSHSTPCPKQSTLSPTPTTLYLPFPLPTSPIPLAPSVYHTLPRWLRNASGVEAKNREKSDNEVKAGVEGIKTVGGWVREGVDREEKWYLGAAYVSVPIGKPMSSKEAKGTVLLIIRYRCPPYAPPPRIATQHPSTPSSHPTSIHSPFFQKSTPFG